MSLMGSMNLSTKKFLRYLSYKHIEMYGMEDVEGEVSDAEDQKSFGKVSSAYMSARCIPEELQQRAGMKTDDGISLVGSLPLHLLMDIFLRLPAESLVQSRAVCREWHEMITDEDFVELHLEQSRSRGENGILFKTTHENSFLRASDFTFGGSSFGFQYQLATLSFDYTGRDLHIKRHNIQIEECIRQTMMNEYQEVDKFTSLNFSILDSCNGLLLLGITCNNIHRLSVCNPTTRSFKLLPSLGYTRVERLYWTIVYEASDRIHRIIGLSSKLRILDFYEDDHRPMMWREMNVLQATLYPCGVLASVYADQRIHFLMRYWSIGVGAASMMSIDTITGQLIHIPHFPTLPPVSSPFDTQFSSKGKFFTAFNLWGIQLDLWVLSDMEYPVWARYRVVELETVYGLLPLDELRSDSSFPRPVTLFDEERKLLLKFGKTMLIYDMESKKWERAGEKMEAYITLAGEYDMANLRACIVHSSSLISFGKKKKVKQNQLGT